MHQPVHAGDLRVAERSLAEPRAALVVGQRRRKDAAAAFDQRTARGVERHLRNVCPNCGGGLVPRPIRPRTEWRPGLSVGKRPPSDKRVHLSYSLQDIQAHSERIAAIPPEQR